MGANLPAGLNRKASNLHAEGGAPGARSGALLVGKGLVAAGPACELDNQALSHEVGAVYCALATRHGD